MKISSITIVAILAMAIGFGIAWFVRQSQSIKLEAGTWFGNQASALPDFKLIDQNGNKLARDDLRGKWQLVFFGYTHCPDICPTSLQTLADVVKAIDDKDVSKALQIVFVSVDPDRDRPEILKSYVEYFNPEFVGATGTATDLEKLTGAIGVGYFLDRSGDDQVSYEVAHSSAFVLLNPSVQFAGIFGAPHDSQAIARDLTKIIERY